MNIGELTAKIRADIGPLQEGMAGAEKAVHDAGKTMSDEFYKVENQIKKVGQTMASVGKKMSLFVTTPIVTGLTMAFKSASDLNENINKTEVAFKDASDEVKAWSKTTLVSFGLAQSSALDAASLYGDMATSMGLNTKEAAKLSMALVGLGADLSSFKNIGIEQAQTALSGIFTGETESLKRLGIVMTETTLKEYAFKTGITKSIDSMTQAEKVQLRYNYVMSVTTNAQGDFLRTSEGAANQMRLFKESLKETSAAFGSVLLPVITPVIKKINELIQVIGRWDTETKKIVLTVAAVVAAIGPLLTGLGYTAIGLAKVSAAVKFLSVAIAANPVGALLTGIGAAALICIPSFISWIKETKAMRDQILVSIEPMKQYAEAFGTIDLAVGKTNKSLDLLTLSQLKQELKDVNMVLSGRGVILGTLSDAQRKETETVRASLQAEINLREKSNSQMDLSTASYDSLNAAIEANNKIINASNDPSIIASLRSKNKVYQDRITVLDTLGVSIGSLERMEREQKQLTEKLSIATTRSEITRIQSLIDKKQKQIDLEKSIRGENVGISIPLANVKPLITQVNNYSDAQKEAIKNAATFGWTLDNAVLNPIKKLKDLGQDGGFALDINGIFSDLEAGSEKASNMLIVLKESLRGLGQQLSQGADSWADFGKAAANAIRSTILGLIAEGIAAAITQTLAGPSGKLGPIGVGIAALAGSLAAGLLGTAIPKFGKGAYVDTPTVAMVGDSVDRKGEWILNSEQMKGVLTAPIAALTNSFQSIVDLISPENISKNNSRINASNSQVQTVLSTIGTGGGVLTCEVDGRALKFILNNEEKFLKRN